VRPPIGAHAQVAVAVVVLLGPAVQPERPDGLLLDEAVLDADRAAQAPHVDQP